VGEAFRPLSFQALELYAENRSLPLGKPVFGPVDQKSTGTVAAGQKKKGVKPT